MSFAECRAGTKAWSFAKSESFAPNVKAATRRRSAATAGSADDIPLYRSWIHPIRNLTSEIIIITIAYSLIQEYYSKAM